MQSVYIHAYIQYVTMILHVLPGCESSTAAAAEEGHFDLLEWAQKNEYLWNARTCIAAAEMAHLIILQWARENGCPWGEICCAKAAGCPW